MLIKHLQINTTLIRVSHVMSLNCSKIGEWYLAVKHLSLTNLYLKVNILQPNDLHLCVTDL